MLRDANFGNMGFEVGFDVDTKEVSIDNKVSNININDRNAKVINLGSYNYVNLRELEEVLGKEVGFTEGKIIVK